VQLTDFETAVGAAIRRRGLLDGVARLVVAVSGGPDSMALLYALLRIGRASGSGPQLIVAHLDHALRPESADDAAFVAAAAANAGLESVIERVDVASAASAAGQNVEAMGRELRYAFLARIAADRAAEAVASGHTASDQAETVIMRLARGAGVDGLAGIAASRELAPGVRLVRPLLGLTRDDVLAYCRDREIRFLDDATNADLHRSRAFVRHELLPRLERLSPGAAANLARAARLAEDDRKFFSLRIAEAFDEWGIGPIGAVSLPVAAVAELEPALRRRVLREAVRRVRGDLTRIDARHIDSIDGLLGDDRIGREVVLPEGLRARRLRETLVVDCDVEMRQCSSVQSDGSP
jgi:tRNA(Ile)-lysidine synthase